MKDGQKNDKSGRLNTFSVGRPSFKATKFKPSFSRLRKAPKVAAAGVIALSLLLGLGGGFVGAKIADRHSSSTIAAKQQYVSDESALIASIAKTVGASVVSVDVQSQSTATDIFGFSQPTSQQSAGTFYPSA